MFCRYCGREIPEGQTCSCQAQASANQEPVSTPVATAAPAAGSDVGKVIGDAFKSMPAASKQLLNGGAGIGLPATIIFACACLLAYILGWVLMITGMRDDIKEVMRGSDELVNEAYKGFYGNAIWVGILSFVIPTCISMVMAIVGFSVKKQPIDWAKAFSSTIAVSVLPAALFLLGGLMFLMSTKLGVILILAAIMSGTVAYYKLYTKIVANKSLVSDLIIAVILTLTIVLVGWIIVSALGKYILIIVLSILYSMFNSLLGAFM